MPAVSTASITAIALLAFAGNSVLCRLALAGGAIDAASFTIVRLLAGAVTLFFVVALTRPANNSDGLRRLRTSPLLLFSGRRALAPLSLFTYAVCFSFAYITLDTGTGALILFGAVQLTMILAGLLKGNRLTVAEWSGLGIAFAGFVYLVAPGINTPSLAGFLLMTLSGIAWAGYTLIGRGSSNPIEDTATNFMGTVPLVAGLALISIGRLDLSPGGFVLAILSGSLASGIGYFIWYKALPDLSITGAAVVQLLVPVIAALGGVVFSGETITGRLIIAACLVLGGILAVFLGKKPVPA